jgi:hypothetical protein
MGNEFFGTPQEIEEARAIRRQQVRAWGKAVVEEADRVKFNTTEDWSKPATVVEEPTEPEPVVEPVVEPTEPTTEPKPETKPTASRSSSKGSSDAK